MKNSLKVSCQNCHNKFWKYKKHVKENLKLGHSFYCSRICLSKHHNKQITLSCENNNCGKLFKKQRKEISTHNYCSSSCAAIVNNQRYPKWPKRFCKLCEKEFKNRDSDYCSIKCGYTATRNFRLIQSRYTTEELVSNIKSFYEKHQRVPAKREVMELVGTTTNKFGSWNNAVIAAGFKPHRSHDNRMYKRASAIASDGHKCDSISELLIDNWLFKNKISHTRDAQYPSTNHKADWVIVANIFIEYFGLAKDSPRYDREIKVKQDLCKKHRIKLVEIYPSDLYPTMALDKKLKFLI